MELVIRLGYKYFKSQNVYFTSVLVSIYGKEKKNKDDFLYLENIFPGSFPTVMTFD